MTVPLLSVVGTVSPPNPAKTSPKTLSVELATQLSLTAKLWPLLFFIFSALFFAREAVLFKNVVHPLPWKDGGPPPCQRDNEGNWSIGIFGGHSPLAMQPLEHLRPPRNGSVAWPAANPVLTCSSVVGQPSNFVADPFLIQHEGNLYMFHETKSSLTMQGDIGAAVSSDNGVTWQHLGVVLDEEWHLSYPFVFEHEGDMYMMPEGARGGNLKLYKAAQFPTKWLLHKIVMERPMIDTSMVEFGGKFWLFGSRRPRKGEKKCLALEIYHSDSPLGPWTAHVGNPFKAQRSAGRPVVYNGTLIRFGQLCDRTYGHKINAWRIEELTLTHFREVEVPLGYQEPETSSVVWNSMRYHHIDPQQLPDGTWVAAIDGDRYMAYEYSSRFRSRTFYAALACTALLLAWWFWPERPPPPPPPPAVKLGALGLPVVPSRGPSISKQRNRSFLLEAQTFVKEAPSGTVLGTFFRTACAFVGVLLLVAALAMAATISMNWLGHKIYSTHDPIAIEGQVSKFTLQIMTYESRLSSAKRAVQHYSRCASVGEILIIWNEGKIPTIDDFDSAVPLRVRIEEKNSLNNRFKPDPKITNRAVLTLDDDIMTQCSDLELGFATWRMHPERLVGYHPRSVEGNPLLYPSERQTINRGLYNMIASGSAFIDSQTYFPAYFSQANDRGRDLVDNLFNCEDMLMNFLVSKSVGEAQAVQFVRPASRIDTSFLSRTKLSGTLAHKNNKERCLKEFTEFFGGNPLRSWNFDWGPRGPPVCGVLQSHCLWL